jgi:hypothetical protein
MRPDWWRRPAAAAPPLDVSLEERIVRLESVVEGLQDALYREALRHNEHIDELRARTEPGEIARALSEDARRRGLE